MAEAMQTASATAATEPKSRQTGLKLVALALAVAAAGLPVNGIAIYALLVAAAVVVLTGIVRVTPQAWGAAVAIVVVGIGAQAVFAPPRIDEGFNVFLPGAALQRDLPPDVYRYMSEQFDKRYPADKRCDAATPGCWRNTGAPDHAYAFAADGIFHKSDMSRAVTSFDLSDPVWHRLGFINDSRYNWYPLSDVQRAHRDGRFWKGYDRWQLTMPWFVTIRLPAAYAGGQLCWRGDVLWEGVGERFAPLHGEGCRLVTPEDAGRRVVGVAIKPGTLAMRLQGPLKVRLLQGTQPLVKLLTIVALIVVLVRIRPRRAVVPLILIALAALIIAIDDASFLGGVRPFDGGDDGMFYDSVGRAILQKLLAGNWAGFFEGGEAVFYYGGPGLRYFRALEHIVFGDSFLGYLSLVLALPLMVLALFRRLLSPPWPLVLALLFVAVPVGELFGTTFIDYAKWASRGFADPMAYILFIAGLVPLLGSRETGPRDAFVPAFFGALLIVLGVTMKPIIVVAALVMIGGSWLHAAYRRQWRRVVGLSVGSLPVFSMALHNWVFGHALVLFSSNAQDSDLLVMPPSAWAGALRELATFDFAGGLAHRALMQIVHWLSGPAESIWTVPLNAAGFALLVYVVARGRVFDPWLRLVGAAALAQHAVALFYAATPRYHFLTWFLTLLACAVFMQQVGLPWLQRRYPEATGRLPRILWSPRLAAGIGWLDGKAN